MKSFRDLFEQYKKGILDDTMVGELNSLMIESYFDSTDELSSEETEYAEDLIIDFFAKNDLDQKYLPQLEKKLKIDKLFFKKFTLILNLNDAVELDKKRKLNSVSEPIGDDLEEEKHLAEVLEKVIDKVHNESEKSLVHHNIQNIFKSIQNFLKELIPSIEFDTPQVKFAMIAVAIIVLGIIVVNVNTSDEPDQLSAVKLNNSESLQYGSNIVSDSSNLEDNNESLELSKRQKLENLIAANYSPSPRFSYSFTRSIYSSSIDKLILGAQYYNDENYDSCLLVLNDLLQNQSFKNVDTLSMIHFYMGNSLLTQAINMENEIYLIKSIESFNKIDPGTDYYNPSRWYLAFAYLEQGNENESIQLFDTLIQINYYRSEEAKVLKSAILDLK